jgi:hypothetical protein
MTGHRSQSGWSVVVGRSLRQASRHYASEIYRSPPSVQANRGGITDAVCQYHHVPVISVHISALLFV